MSSIEKRTAVDKSLSPVGFADSTKPIHAIPLRHPWRWVSSGVVIVLFGLFIYGAATNDNYHWDVYWEYLFDTRIAQAAVHTIELTAIAMVVGLLLGILLAVMRLSSNAVLQWMAWLYLWIFRGTPVYVQLVFWGLVPAIYPELRIGIPFGPTFFTVESPNGIGHLFWFAAIGLALNEAAYMAEIVRAGISSVPEGQEEASKALGMSWGLTMRRTVLPQAMRVIVPPTGNELISMLKTTSLVSAVPYTGELYGRARDVGVALFDPLPLLLVAATWYLAITSVLMVIQHYVEKRFSRGTTRHVTPGQLRALADAEAVIPQGMTVIESSSSIDSEEGR